MTASAGMTEMVQEYENPAVILGFWKDHIDAKCRHFDKWLNIIKGVPPDQLLAFASNPLMRDFLSTFGVTPDLLSQSPELLQMIRDPQIEEELGYLDDKDAFDAADLFFAQYNYNFLMVHTDREAKLLHTEGYPVPRQEHVNILKFLFGGRGFTTFAAPRSWPFKVQIPGLSNGHKVIWAHWSENAKVENCIVTFDNGQ